MWKRGVKGTVCSAQRFLLRTGLRWPSTFRVLAALGREALQRRCACLACRRFILTRAGGQPIEKFVQAKKWRARLKLESKLRGQGGVAPPVAAPPGARR